MFSPLAAAIVLLFTESAAQAVTEKPADSERAHTDKCYDGEYFLENSGYSLIYC